MYQKKSVFHTHLFCCLRTLFVGIPVLIALSIIFIPLFFCLLVPERYRYNRFLYALLSIGYTISAYGTLLPLKITGQENLPDTPVIIAANHQSSLDIPLVGLIVGTHKHLWLVYDKYARTPVLGLIVRRLFVPVTTENSRASAQSVITLLKRAQKIQGHIIIFPEGGRYNDGTIHPFFSGFALLAKKTGRPVVPVFMPHNGTALPPKTYTVNPVKLTLTIGKPIFYTPEDTDQSFTEKVYAWFVLENTRRV